ncbi:MAG: hypothetical protein ACOCT8_03170 [Actinomycetota bacterium]
MGRLTNAQLEATAREFAEHKATERAARDAAKPLGEALLAELATRKKDQLEVGGVTVTRRSKRTVVRDPARVLKALSRRRALLARVIRVSARDWAAAVRDGEISAELDQETIDGWDESAPWAEVTLR